MLVLHSMPRSIVAGDNIGKPSCSKVVSCMHSCVMELHRAALLRISSRDRIPRRMDAAPSALPANRTEATPFAYVHVRRAG